MQAYEKTTGDTTDVPSFVVRCTLAGACERATETTNHLSIAGTFGVFVPGRVPHPDGP